MKKNLKGALVILLIAIVVLYMADLFEKDEENPKTEYYPDKGSYTYFYTPPETAVPDEQSSGIYFYAK